MKKRRARGWVPVMAGMVLWAALGTPRADAADGGAWASDLASALKAARKDGRPVLLLIRRTSDVASLDAGHWLRSGEGLAGVLEKFHRVMLWSGAPDLKKLPFAPRAGLVFLTAKAQPVAIEKVPLLRARLKSVLEKTLRWPRSIPELAGEALAHLSDAALVERAAGVLQGAGRADQAAHLLRAAIARAEAKPGAGTGRPVRTWKRRLEEIKPLVPLHVAQLMGRSARLLAVFKDPKNRKNVRPALLAQALLDLDSAFQFKGKQSASLRKRAAETRKALQELIKKPQAKAAQQRVVKAAGALLEPLKARAKELFTEAGASVQAYRAAHPERFKVQLARLREAVQKSGRDQKAGAQARALTEKLLQRPMDQDEGMRAAGIVTYAALRLNLAGEARERWAKKLLRAAPAGRLTADALLDLADAAWAAGARGEAKKRYKDAEKAAQGGESPTLFRAARAMRAICEGKDSPNRSKWAKRSALDVLVLASDLAGFARAIARWDDKTFFPVLFQDDLYAPKFAAAFHPGRVILLPPEKPAPAADSPILTPGALRRALLASWTRQKDEKVLPKNPVDELLRARLESLGVQPRGVVFGDGVSGETAGGLALAAGRFQGFEFLPVPTVGRGKKKRPAKVRDYLSEDAARRLARRVEAGLARWGLPYKERWASVTLAGAYPYRYSGAPFQRWGRTYALDDLLGRGEDRTRIAAVGRLLGNQARSAYQAMCSLFLAPKAAFLFNTYGTNPKSIWGRYRMDFAEAAWKERLKITHYRNKQANVAAFRARTQPWNRYPLLMVNSSGGAANWSVKGGGGTADDFPVGVPVAIHVTHSGSAANPYSPDTLAGRALWGGAFWYFGSTAEPFLTSFQPPSHYAPRIAAGAPFASIFRQRTAQGFWLPWRLMIAGDPQFCLRKKSLKRQPYKLEDGPLVRPGEMTLAAERRTLPAGKNGARGKQASKAAWLAALRRARWLGRREAALRWAGKHPAAATLSGAGLALVLEEQLRAGQAQAALDLWAKAKGEARKHYAARLYARQAAGHVLDVALAAKDPGRLMRHLEALLSTAPARNFVQRWLREIGDVAQAQKKEEGFLARLAALAKDKRFPAFRALLSGEIKRLRFAKVTRKQHWSGADKSEALKLFAAFVTPKSRKRTVQKNFNALAKAYLAKVKGASVQGFGKDLDAQFKRGSREGKLIRELWAAFQKKRSLRKKAAKK